MPSGLELMLKSMGIDVEAIKSVVNPETIKGIVVKVETLDSRLTNIENSLLRIETKLETLPTDVAMKYISDNEKMVIAEVQRMYGRNSDNCN